MAIYALHGFLGQPKDWADLLPEAHTPNLFEGEIAPFPKWAKMFNENIPNEENILIGYSLGGRLALHALLDEPKKWKKAILVSTHPGLKTLEEREKRVKEDLKWSQRFLHDPWDALMNDWNKQPVFSDVVHREETDFSRKALGRALVTWSLGKQEILPIEELNMPILWITGELDRKFTDLVPPQAKKLVAPQAGHRVPWQQKLWFQQEVRSFICQ